MFQKGFQPSHGDFFLKKILHELKNDHHFINYSYFFWVKGMLHICKEGCIFLKNFIPSKHSFLGIVQVQAFIGYTLLFGQ